MKTEEQHKTNVLNYLDQLNNHIFFTTDNSKFLMVFKAIDKSKIERYYAVYFTYQNEKFYIDLVKTIVSPSEGTYGWNNLKSILKTSLFNYGYQSIKFYKKYKELKANIIQEINKYEKPSSGYSYKISQELTSLVNKFIASI